MTCEHNWEIEDQMSGHTLMITCTECGEKTTALVVERECPGGN